MHRGKGQNLHPNDITSSGTWWGESFASFVGGVSEFMIRSRAALDAVYRPDYAPHHEPDRLQNLWPTYMFGNEMNLEGFMVEARAKIMWGESPSSVHEFLTSNGISAEEADATIKELMLERNAEIRRLGIGRIVIGSVLIGVPGILLYALFSRSSVGIGVGRASAFLILAALYGLWKLVDGILFLVRPKAEHRSIPDISQ